jgi:hypothetical protein
VPDCINWIAGPSSIDLHFPVWPSDLSWRAPRKRIGPERGTTALYIGRLFSLGIQILYGVAMKARFLLIVVLFGVRWPALG